MFKNIKKVIEDILYVSKVTKTNRKKLTIIYSVLLSQFIAFSDIFIILFFTNIFTKTELLIFFGVDLSVLFSYKILLPTIILIRYIFQYLQSIILKKLQLNVQKKLKVYMLSEIFDKKNYSTSDTFFYINELTAHISFFYSSIANLLNYLLQALAFSIFLFITEPETIITFTAGIILLVFPISYLIKNARIYMNQSFEYGREASKDIQRVVENMFLIKLLKNENSEIVRFSNIIKKLNNSGLNNHRFSILNGYLPSFITVFFLSIITLYFSQYFTITLAFIGVTLRMFQSISLLSTSLNAVINSHVHLVKFYKLESQNKSSFSDNYVKLQDYNSNEIIFLDNVSFKYFDSDVKIFENITLKIEKGSHVLLTGSNGSGKSTLLGLIAGVYYPEKGKIFSNSKKLGFVGPNPLIFSDTLRNNLTYGSKEKIDDKVLINYLDEFKLFPNNEVDLDQEVNNKSLSSGQMQKISFIRAFVQDIDVLILDESTSNLDNKSKSDILNTLKNTDMTIINSTHDVESFLSIGISEKINIEYFEGKRMLKTSKI